MSVILLNLVSGPPLFRAAIVAVGEARALQLPSLAGDVFDDGPFQRTPSMPKTASKCVLQFRVWAGHSRTHAWSRGRARACLSRWPGSQVSVSLLRPCDFCQAVCVMLVEEHGQACPQCPMMSRMGLMHGHLPGRPQLAGADTNRSIGSGADAAANGLSLKPSGGAVERDDGRGAIASPRLSAVDRRSDGDAFT